MDSEKCPLMSLIFDKRIAIGMDIFRLRNKYDKFLLSIQEESR